MIVSQSKNKGEKSDCSNYIATMLLAIASKIRASVLLDRLILTIAKVKLPESQCDLRANCGPVDVNFNLWQIQEKSRDHNMGLET